VAKRLQTYAADEIMVTFDPNLCVHSARCLSALPAVFDVGRRKWVDPSAAPADDVARVVELCPSGALQYARTGAAGDVGPRPAPSVTVVTLSTDGPLLIEGHVRVRAADGETIRETDRVALCRCGGTRNQPFCDSGHLRVGFKSTR
jgi:uncharacterized Fe-S cluster protein YjdI